MKRAGFFSLSTLPNGAEILFSLKCFAGSMLALYVASRLGLPRPFWSMMTAYVVASPFSGAVRSKALYRVGGTALGSTATVLLVPRLVDSPELLSLALACWVGLCLYISLLDRTPRAYVFMLAGYTAGLIGFPVVSDPSAMFDVALARVEEISIGILCASLVHSLVFPQGLGPVLLARVDKSIADAQRWIVDALGKTDEGRSLRDRRTLAADITELRVMATHLPFDTSHLRWMSGTIGALQDRLTLMVPLLSAIEDRLRALRRTGSRTISQSWDAVLHDIAAWAEAGHVADAGAGIAGATDATDDTAADRARATSLRLAVDALVPPVVAGAGWHQILQLNLATRLRSLIDTHEASLALREDIGGVLHGARPIGRGHEGVQSPRVLHRDRGLALRSAFAAVIAITSCCAFWIITGWPSGSAAPMMAAVFCSFFATQDDPVPGIAQFLKYTILSTPISAFYLLVALPAVHSYEMLVLVTAPTFLVLGCYAGRPATSLRAMAMIFGIAGTLSLQDTNTSDLVSFINSNLAQILGISAAAFFTKLLRTVSAQWTARRLLRAGWRELTQMATGERNPSIMAVSARMLDRIGLLTPRLAIDGPQADLSAVDALGDLRIGLNMAQLRELQLRLQRNGVSLQPLMAHLATHFRTRQTGEVSGAVAAAVYAPLPAAPALLEVIDAALRAVCAAPRPAADMTDADVETAVTSLASLRRDLFPDAPAYDARYQDQTKENP